MPLDAIEDNVDRRGTNLTTFAHKLFHDGLHYGAWMVLVDHPAGDPENPRSQEQDEFLGIRPYWVRIPADQVIGWVYEEVDGGMPRLIQLRWQFRETVTEGAYGFREVDVIRVWNAPAKLNERGEPLERGTHERWERVEADKPFAQVFSRPHTYPGVPLVRVPFRDEGTMESKPVFEKTLWLNIAHWQSSSRQRNYLEFVRVGVLFGSGFDEDRVKAGLRVGPAELNGHSDPQAKLSYVETSGAPLAAGKADLDDLKLAMERTALEPLMAVRGDPTATGRKIDAEDKGAAIKTWVRLTEAGLRQLYDVSAKWRRNDPVPPKLAEKFKADIYSDFPLVDSRIEEVRELRAMAETDMLSVRTLLEETKRRAMLSESFTVETELVRLSDQASQRLGMHDDDEDGEGEDEDDAPAPEKDGGREKPKAKDSGGAPRTDSVPMADESEEAMA